MSSLEWCSAVLSNRETCRIIPPVMLPVALNLVCVLSSITSFMILIMASTLWCARRRIRQWHVLCWYCWLCYTSRFAPFCCRQAEMLDNMAGMNQRDIYVAWCLWFRLQKTVDFPQLQFFRRSSIFLSWCTGRFPWSCCSADHGVSTVAVLARGDRCPRYAGRASSSTSLPVVCNDRCLPWRRGISPCSSCSADH